MAQDAGHEGNRRDRASSQAASKEFGDKTWWKKDKICQLSNQDLCQVSNMNELEAKSMTL